MRTAIIIDDRTERKKRHLSEESLNELYSLVNRGLLKLSDGSNFSLNNFDSIMNEYDLIAIHRSYLINCGIINSLPEYIKKYKRYIIVFSGGVSQNTVLNKGYQLTVDSSDFYTEKLPSFVEDFCKVESMKSPLLKFLYGASWKLTLLLKYRYFLWTYGDIDDIDDRNDESEAEELKRILWNDKVPKNMDDINNEIEQEKERFLNL